MKINCSLYNDSRRVKMCFRICQEFRRFFYKNTMSVEQLPRSLVWLFFLSYSILVVVGMFDMGDI